MHLKRGAVGHLFKGAVAYFKMGREILKVELLVTEAVASFEH